MLYNDYEESPMTKSTGVGRGGKREGAGRPRLVQPEILDAESVRAVDPRAVLASIAADRYAPHASRVSAAKAMILAEQSKPAAESSDGVPDDAISRRTMEIMRQRLN
jgi:hypothetical protein